jgi:hypothetical protein
LTRLSPGEPRSYMLSAKHQECAVVLLRISFLTKPSKPGVIPHLLAAPVGDFADLKDARELAFREVVDDPRRASTHSIIIESADDSGTTYERWIKGEADWERDNAPRT